jgi:AcrR family transcriptional regulator
MEDWMSNESSGTKRHILDAAEKILADRRSSEIHIADIAEEANVAVQTLYYHFGSLRQLIAEAQASAYLRMVEPLHKYLLAAEQAVLDEDEQTYWQAIGDDVALAWSYGYSGDKWKIPKLFIDIWADPKTQEEFTEGLERQFERWINVIEAGKALGWVDPDVDTYALIVANWGASNGQAVFASASKIHYTPESIRDFFQEIAMKKG